jgi:hypothetical protein
MNKKKLWSLIAAPGLATMGLLLAFFLLGWSTVGAAPGRAGPLLDPLAQDDSFTVSGTVTCEGVGPLSGVEVFVWYRDQGQGVLSDTTDSNGYYSVMLEAGNYDLIFNPPCGSGCASKALKGITGPSDLTLDVVLPPGHSVSGRAYATDGATPVSTVAIYAYNRDTADGFGLPPTDPNGFYCINLMEGEYDLGFTPPPCLGLGPKTYVIPVDQDTNHNVTLPVGFTVGGCITDGASDPVAGVQIYAFDPSPGVGGYGFAPTDETGCYSGTLPTGTFDFQFIPPPGRDLGSITVVDVDNQGSGCPNTSLSVTLPPGLTLSGKATCNGAPLKNVFVYAEPLEGVSPDDDLVGWGLYTVDDGSYQLPLVPGVYSLKFIPPPATGLDPKNMAAVKLEANTVLNVNLCGACSGDWVIETVDSADNVGAHTSLALEPTYPHAPHISYRDVTKDGLKHARLRGTNWFSDVVDSGGDWTSLALMPTSPYTPCISNYDSNGYALRYAWRNGITWTIELVDRGGMHGTSLALASTYPYTPHISYFVPFDVLDLKHAYRNGDYWVTETVDSEGSVGTYNSLALDQADYPHISYRDWSNYDLKYAWLGSTTWFNETVDSAGDVGDYTSLALDSGGNPHISYFDETNDNLKYARLSEAAWTIETVDSVGDVGRFTSLALDSNDNSYVSYYDATNDDLKLAYSNGTAWFIQTVDSGGDVGQSSSLALDGDGCPHISYYDATNGDLKYARLPAYRIYLPLILKNY